MKNSAAAPTLFLLFGLSILASSPVAAFASFPNFLPNGTVYRCATCHENPAGGGTRNSFGLEVQAVVSGGTFSWADIYALDADDDGQSNGEELGDPCGIFDADDGWPARAADISHPADDTSLSIDPHNPSSTAACDDETGPSPGPEPAPEPAEPGLGAGAGAGAGAGEEGHASSDQAPDSGPGSTEVQSQPDGGGASDSENASPSTEDEPSEPDGANGAVDNIDEEHGERERCTVQENEDGTATLSCPDGTTTTYGEPSSCRTGPRSAAGPLALLLMGLPAYRRRRSGLR